MKKVNYLYPAALLVVATPSKPNSLCEKMKMDAKK
jgi:hypothetical protein